ncbi:neurogenic locus notch homolog protein 1 [Strongylocentrotus purpuratus]|uniref:Uncharacterized protein n=1 Tax=Strongylocentrotus purpuratus TaxID=7668 RepID=A0A7M7NYH8_STRPU|nr:neurogenic locus notch homolog protein 1 [Strongylocentrotus purpuratus]
MNETNPLHYRDGDVITYRCLDGYEGPKNRTPSDDGTSTCNDGSWYPPGIPTCMDIDDCSNHMCRNGATCVDKIDSYECLCPDGFNGNNCENVTTEMTTNIPASPGSTSEPVLTTDNLDVTTMELTTPATLPETEKPPITPLPCGGECKSTQVCNAENNCECRPDYYEDEEDPENPCKEPESFDVTITITKVNNTNAEYNVELEDPSSPEFKKLEIDVCEPFEEIYKNDTEYKDCRVLEFSNGSIIVNYVLTFAENSTQSASTVNTTVQQELQNPNGSFTGAYEFDDSSLVVAPLDECNRKMDDCDPENAICTDQGEDGYTCECREGFDDVGIPKSLPGRECMESTEPQPTEPHLTEPHPTDPRTTEEPEEPGVEPWKIAVGVTVPIIAIIIVGLTCWQYRRLHRTSTSVVTKSQTIHYNDDTSGSLDPEAVKPGSMTIMNDYGTEQEVVLPLDDIPLEEKSNSVPDKGKD